MTRARDVADTQDNLGGPVSPFLAGKNKIINGDFGVWQRGTTVSSTSGTLLTTYLADRWTSYYFGGGNTANYTMSQQAQTPGAIPGCETPFFIRHAFPVSNATTYWEFINRIEDVRTLAGQKISFSFWAKTTGTQYYPTIEIQQNFGSGGSSTVYEYIGAQTFTSSWARYTYTTTLPSISGKTIGAGNYLQFKLYFGPTGGSGSAFNLDIAGVQLELGSVATPFVPAGGGSPQAELALCQRYYFRNYANDAYGAFGWGTASGTANVVVYIPTPVTMRTYPTAIDYSTLQVGDGVSGTVITSTSFSNQGSRQIIAINAVVSSGLTQYRPYALQSNNNTSGYLGLSAEL